MKTVAIVGVGLIGGSFGLALREAGFAGEILGVSSTRAIEAALQMGAISAGATLSRAAATADLIYLSQPIDGILKTLEELGPIAPAECLITDAGSTKAAIVSKAAECVRVATFVGGHPLAGKEQRGVGAADAKLFAGRPYVLTPTKPAGDGGEQLRTWLRRMGANITEMSAAHHDKVVAFTSHLPQLLATALSNTLAKTDDPNIERIFGPGLLDMTRLGLSSVDLWQSILATNKEQVLLALDAFDHSLSAVREAIERGDLRPFFAAAHEFASSIRNVSLKSQRTK